MTVYTPSLRLKSRKPLWRDPAAVNVSSQSREDWQSATAMNSYLVNDPTIRLSGFHLPRHLWPLLSLLQAGHGHCGTCSKKWGLAENEMCLRWHSADVTHHQLLSPDQIWQRSTTSTHCRQSYCLLADFIGHLEAYDDNILLVTHSLVFSFVLCTYAVRIRGLRMNPFLFLAECRKKRLKPKFHLARLDTFDVSSPCILAVSR